MSLGPLFRTITTNGLYTYKPSDSSLDGYSLAQIEVHVDTSTPTIHLSSLILRYGDAIQTPPLHTLPGTLSLQELSVNPAGSPFTFSNLLTTIAIYLSDGDYRIELVSPRNPLAIRTLTLETPIYYVQYPTNTLTLGQTISLAFRDEFNVDIFELDIDRYVTESNNTESFTIMHPSFTLDLP